MDPYVEDHLQWRLMTPADKDALGVLREQIEAFDDTMLSAVEHLVSTHEPELDANCVGGWDRYGSLLAYGWNLVDSNPDVARVTLAGGVHPTHRYQSIGRKIILWQQARAIEWRDTERPGRPLRLGCYAETAQPSLRHLLELLGFSQERHFIDLHRPLDDVPVPRGVDGISFVPFDPTRSDELHRLHHLCFRSDVDAEQDHWETSLARVRPDWSWLALQGGEAVGYVFSGEDDAAAVDGMLEGWTERLGVHPEHRHRGIASALLEHTLVSMASSGCPGAGIGVDTTDGEASAKLRARLGYETRDSVLLMGKNMPGDDSVS